MASFLNDSCVSPRLPVTALTWFALSFLDPHGSLRAFVNLFGLTPVLSHT
jgi:hypothetical protein